MTGSVVVLGVGMLFVLAGCAVGAVGLWRNGRRETLGDEDAWDGVTTGGSLILLGSAIVPLGGVLSVMGL